MKETRELLKQAVIKAFEPKASTNTKTIKK
jgi:hypothetical protein